MDGDGTDDYIWVGPNGEIDIYLNVNNRPLWDNHLGVVTLGVPRKTIRIADLDGDGKCDVSSILSSHMPKTSSKFADAYCISLYQLTRHLVLYGCVSAGGARISYYGCPHLCGNMSYLFLEHS